MRIVQINAVNGILSTGIICKELADYMHAQGHECYTLFSTEQKTDQFSIRIGIDFESKVHALLSRILGLQGYFSPLTTHKIIKELDVLKPDIVHLGNLHSNYVNLGTLLSYLGKNNIPTVITLHDCWFYTGKCMHYSAIECNRWINGCYNCPKLKKDNKSLFFDFTKKMWKDKKKWFECIPILAVVGVSDWVTREGTKSFLGQHAVICKRIYNWIDLDTFKPKKPIHLKKELGLDGKRIVLGIASIWDERKGLSIFIDLAAKLSSDTVILLVGNVPKVRLPQNIITLPLIKDRNKLAEIYSMADVFVQASEEETFGLVVAEALSCGTPIITNSMTANPELVDINCGYVISSFDDLYDRITKVLNNGKAFYSENCRSFAELHFNKEKNLQEYLSLYEELLSIESIRK